MKVNGTLLALGLISALPLMAFAEPTNSVQSASAAKTQIEPAYPAAQYKLVDPKLAGKVEKEQITRIGKESSQAWTTIASQQPNPTLVHNLSTHEPSFYVCSFGHKPWQ
jgi:hypothetical protein